MICSGALMLFVLLQYYAVLGRTRLVYRLIANTIDPTDLVNFEMLGYKEKKKCRNTAFLNFHILTNYCLLTNDFTKLDLICRCSIL